MISNDMATIKGPLKGMLETELKAGNRISGIEEGNYPRPGGRMIFLERSFQTSTQKNLPGVEYRLVNDPHYWKAEYVDEKNNLCLCCGFSK